MRPAIYAAFLLMSTRLFADPIIASGNYEIVATQCGTAEAYITLAPLTAFCGPLPGGSSNASSFTSANHGLADASILGLYAAGASSLEDVTVLITGGIGPGTFRLIGSGSAGGDAAALPYWHVNADYSGGQLRINNDPTDATASPYGSFTYGVPQIIRVGIVADFQDIQPDALNASVSAAYSGIEVVNSPDDPTVVPGAIISLTSIIQTPEPSLGLAVGLCLLTALRVRERWTQSPQSHSKS